VSAQAIAQLAREDLAQRAHIVHAVSTRTRAGAAPASAPLAAEAARLRVMAEVEQAQRRQQLATRRLGLLWGDTAASFALTDTDLDALPRVPDYDDLATRLANKPELRRFAHESRLREARLQLARSARTPDLEWQLGIRRLQAEHDWGLVGSIALPLGAARRADPEIRAIEAELAAIEFEREGGHRALQATLIEAWAQLELAVASAHRIDESLLPQLQRAEAAAERAYRAGALGYLEWAQLRTDTTIARRERLDASLAAHRALIELQRLTGETFQVAGALIPDTTP
jgi:cobalt-zinc-cadmium efflux system outer membrane protein